MTQIEVIHEADRSGQRCELCRAEIAGQSHAYAPGERVVVIDGDPLASWRTQRSVTCTPQRRAVRQDGLERDARRLLGRRIA